MLRTKRSTTFSAHRCVALAAIGLALLLSSCEDPNATPAQAKFLYASPREYRVALGSSLSPGLVILPEGVPMPQLVWTIADPTLLSFDAATASLRPVSLLGDPAAKTGRTNVIVHVADKPSLRASFDVEVYDPAALPILGYFDTRPGSYYRYSGRYKQNGVETDFELYLVFQKSPLVSEKHALLYVSSFSGVSAADTAWIVWTEDRVNKVWIARAQTYPWNIGSPVFPQVFTQLLSLPGTADVSSSAMVSKPDMVGSYTINSTSKGYDPAFPDRYKMSFFIPNGGMPVFNHNYPLSGPSIMASTTANPGAYEAQLSTKDGLVSWLFNAEPTWMSTFPAAVHHFRLTQIAKGFTSEFEIPITVQSAGSPVPEAGIAIPDFRNQMQRADLAGIVRPKLFLVPNVTTRIRVDGWGDTDVSDGINSGDKLANYGYELLLDWASTPAVMNEIVDLGSIY